MSRQTTQLGSVARTAGHTVTLIHTDGNTVSRGSSHLRVRTMRIITRGIHEVGILRS